MAHPEALNEAQLELLQELEEFDYDDFGTQKVGSVLQVEKKLKDLEEKKDVKRVEWVENSFGGKTLVNKKIISDAD